MKHVKGGIVANLSLSIVSLPKMTKYKGKVNESIINKHDV